MKRSHCFFLTLAALVIGNWGCQSPKEDSSWKLLNLNTMPETAKKQKEKALSAKEEMFKSLMAKLTLEMGKGGPSHAISVCQEEAPRIAQKVSKEKGVRIGRTSLKLRNPKNQAPAWAKDWIAQAKPEPTFFTNSQGDLAALLPIQLQSQCLFCHGGPEQITPEAKKVLAQRYPNDQATGFKEGDLRGWFWVEVPRMD